MVSFGRDRYAGAIQNDRRSIGGRGRLVFPCVCSLLEMVGSLDLAFRRFGNRKHLGNGTFSI